MPYNYKKAIEVLSDTDKNRILAIYLNSEVPPSQTNWTKASEEFGAASIDSMKVMLRTALKKIETAGGKEDADGTPVKATPRKRKGAAADDGRVDTPVKKPKKGAKATKAATASDDALDEKPAEELDDQKDEVIKTEDAD